MKSTLEDDVSHAFHLLLIGTRVAIAEVSELLIQKILVVFDTCFQ